MGVGQGAERPAAPRHPATASSVCLERGPVMDEIPRLPIRCGRSQERDRITGSRGKVQHMTFTSVPRSRILSILAGLLALLVAPLAFAQAPQVNKVPGG